MIRGGPKPRRGDAEPPGSWKGQEGSFGGLARGDPADTLTFDFWPPERGGKKSLML